MNTETEPAANAQELLDTMLGYLGFVGLPRLFNAYIGLRLCRFIPKKPIA